MKGFKYRQAYAILEKRIAEGALPKGQYKFIIGLSAVTPRVNGTSLNRQQENVLAGIIMMCTTERPGARAA